MLKRSDLELASKELDYSPLSYLIGFKVKPLAQAVAIRRLDDTESRALAERQAKDRAAELTEQAYGVWRIGVSLEANRKKLEEMKNQTQEGS